MRRSVLFSVCLALPVAFWFGRPDAPAAEEKPTKVDVCVYGGTAGGVVAAITAAKQGKTVLLIEPGRHLGGMTSGGLGWTDFGNKAAIGGLSREFYRRLGKHYGKDEVWTFEPHVAEKALKDWIGEHKVTVLYEHRLTGLEKKGERIHSIALARAAPEESGAPAAKSGKAETPSVEAAVFIDCTYEGDLMAAAKVSYTVGREAVAKYDEPLNGIRAKTPHHQFLVKVDPYVKPGDASSGLLPLIQSGDGGKPGDGDKSVQAYNFRLCLTQNEANRLPIKAPAGYDSARYEVLGRHLEALIAAGKKPELRMLLKIDPVPNGKTDINNNGAVSTDFIGANYAYPDGDWATRSKLWNDHLIYTQGLLHYLATSPKVPEHIRNDMAKWGLCKDEFTDTAGWPHQMYVREARRMVGRYVVTQADCEHRRSVDDGVGLGAYNMDSHNCQRLVKDGSAENEGDVQVGPKGPYAVSYRSITPKADECKNLLVPVCVSASHIAYGSIRMEPVFMVLGESAARAACQSIDEQKDVQDIDMTKLRRQLLDAGQVLEFKKEK